MAENSLALLQNIERNTLCRRICARKGLHRGVSFIEYLREATMDCFAAHIDGMRAHPPNIAVGEPLPDAVWPFGEAGTRSWRGLMIPEPGSPVPTAPWGLVPSAPPDTGRGYMPPRLPAAPERATGVLIQIAT